MRGVGLSSCLSSTRITQLKCPAENRQDDRWIVAARQDWERCGQVAERSMAAGCKPAAPCELRGFESSPVHQLIFDFGFLILDLGLQGWDGGRLASDAESQIQNPKSKTGCGSNSVVESQPSKLLVAGSIPVSRSIKAVKSDEFRVTRKRFVNFLLVTRRPSLVTVLTGRCSSVGRARPW